MNSKRFYLLLLGVLILLFAGLLAGTYGTNLLLTDRASKLTALKAKSAALDRQQQALDKAKLQIAEYADLERITKVVVPQEKNQAAAVREIVNIADTYGVTLVDITFPASTLGAVAPAAVGGATPAPAPAAANSKAASLSQLVPVKNIPGVYQLTINASNDDKHQVGYADFIKFLSALEKDRHTAQVTTLSLTPNIENHTLLTFKLSIMEYVKP